MVVLVNKAFLDLLLLLNANSLCQTQSKGMGELEGSGPSELVAFIL